METYYKIVDIKNDQIKTLFHGINHSKVLQKKVWIIADKKFVNDGDGTSYLSGLHIMMSYDECVNYLNRFKNKKEKGIVTCHAEGLRKKEHSPHNVYLADCIKIIDVIYQYSSTYLLN
jgi:hypothetical protein